MASELPTIRVEPGDEDSFHERFEGDMVELPDFPSGTQRIPVWRCRRCGWGFGGPWRRTGHDCPVPRAATEGDDDGA